MYTPMPRVRMTTRRPGAGAPQAVLTHRHHHPFAWHEGRDFASAATGGGEGGGEGGGG
jgi:hypothetical protein